MCEETIWKPDNHDSWNGTEGRYTFRIPLKSPSNGLFTKVGEELTSRGRFVLGLRPASLRDRSADDHASERETYRWHQ